MEKRPVAYQLYLVRKEAEKNLSGVLGTLKELGCSGVEFAGFYGHSAAAVREMPETHGLKAISSHGPLKNIDGRLICLFIILVADGKPAVFRQNLRGVNHFKGNALKQPIQRRNQ